MASTKKLPEHAKGRFKAWEKLAEKYDAATDGRITGKPSHAFVKIACPLCEDEAIVFFYRPGPLGPRRWAARCTCDALEDVRLPKEYKRAITPNKIEWVNLQWTDIKNTEGWPALKESDLLPSRLLAFTDAVGKLDCGIEPRHVLYRRKRQTERS